MTHRLYRLLRSTRFYAQFGLRDPLRRRGKSAKRPSRHPGARLGKHVGRAGERTELTVEVREPPRVLERDDIRFVYRLRDNKTGGVVVWFAPAPLLQVGQAYKLRATVKRHGVFAGVRETLISRVSVVGPVNDNLLRAGEEFDELCREQGILVRGDFSTNAEYEQTRKSI